MIRTIRDESAAETVETLRAATTDPLQAISPEHNLWLETLPAMTVDPLQAFRAICKAWHEPGTRAFVREDMLVLERFDEKFKHTLSFRFSTFEQREVRLVK
jgi:hypothetical protein